MYPLILILRLRKLDQQHLVIFYNDLVIFYNDQVVFISIYQLYWLLLDKNKTTQKFFRKTDFMENNRLLISSQEFQTDSFSPPLSLSLSLTYSLIERERETDESFVVLLTRIYLQFISCCSILCKCVIYNRGGYTISVYLSFQRFLSLLSNTLIILLNL